MGLILATATDVCNNVTMSKHRNIYENHAMSLEGGTIVAGVATGGNGYKARPPVATKDEH